jgi:hypothetical protein
MPNSCTITYEYARMELNARGSENRHIPKAVRKVSFYDDITACSSSTHR